MRKPHIQYVRRKVDGHPCSDRGWVSEHVIISESALGRYLPAGAEVHHVDGNPRNNVQSNLVICQDRRFHRLLHLRADILSVGGNPDTERLCSGCRQCLVFSEFNKCAANKNGGVQRYCRACSKEAYKRWIDETRPRRLITVPLPPETDWQR